MDIYSRSTKLRRRREVDGEGKEGLGKAGVMMMANDIAWLLAL